jgi:cytochrome c-type biogenesis protein CcmH/NrfG
MSQLAERIAQFRKMATDDPENELGHFRLGQLLMEDGQHAEAVKSFERTLELSPQFSKVYQLLGECLIKLG